MKSRRKIIVAIDGPAGSGKSTVGRLVAGRLGWRCVESGAMYRALAWKALGARVPLRPQALERLARRLNLKCMFRDHALRVFVDGKDVTLAVHSEEVSRAVARVAAREGVRRALREKQHALARRGSLVMEGRDIGTEVFPDAAVKVYLDAALRERARRRFRQLRAAGEPARFPVVLKALRSRDALDRRRAASPLRAAPDAVVIRSTHLSPRQVAGKIVRLIGRVS